MAAVPTQEMAMSIRNLLLMDAATCLSFGVLLLAAGAWIAGMTDIPVGLLRVAGAVLLPICINMIVVARAGRTEPEVWSVVVGNVAWVVASVAVMVGPWVSPNGLGQAFIGAQAVAVAALAWLEYRAI
jgi:hypothetical protein